MAEPDDDAGTRAVRAAAARDARISDGFRRRRGVVHTPLPVARFVLDRVDRALRRIGRDGLADPTVRVVDPACGPGVFLAAARERGATRTLGLDVDADALADARAVLGPDASLRHCNTLEAPLPDATGTLVIVGNPPWAGRSANADAAYTDALLADFRRLPSGEALRERKIGVLSDDYVRFVRWAAEQARGAEGGAVLGLVTNASFLDGPVHRAMRAALASWFARVDVIDLGGSALVARRGGRDENVFGVRPAAAITIATRPPGHAERTGEVRYARLRGGRDDKLDALSGLGEGELVRTRAPSWAFTPSPDVPAAYERWISVAALFPFHREGVQTNRDAMCVDADPDALLARLRRFAEGDDDVPGRAGIPTGHYDPDAARGAVRAALARGDAVRRLAYRPLDVQWAALVPKLCHRPRPALLGALARSTGALLTVRKDRGERPWTHAAAAPVVDGAPLAVDNCFLSTRSSCRTRVFPTHRPDGEENVDRGLARALGAPDAAPHDLVRYALAVLSASAYREAFDAALRRDYPRLPPAPTPAAFAAAVEAGADVEAAFGGDPEDPPTVVVGHHAIGSRALDRARGRCDDAMAALGAGDGQA